MLECFEDPFDYEINRLEHERGNRKKMKRIGELQREVDSMPMFHERM